MHCNVGSTDACDKRRAFASRGSPRGEQKISAERDGAFQTAAATDRKAFNRLRMPLHCANDAVLSNFLNFSITDRAAAAREDVPLPQLSGNGSRKYRFFCPTTVPVQAGHPFQQAVRRLDAASFFGTSLVFSVASGDDDDRDGPVSWRSSRSSTHSRHAWGTGLGAGTLQTAGSCRISICGSVVVKRANPV